jgi:hypothetical protein
MVFAFRSRGIVRLGTEPDMAAAEVRNLRIRSFPGCRGRSAPASMTNTGPCGGPMVKTVNLLVCRIPQEA